MSTDSFGSAPAPLSKAWLFAAVALFAASVGAALLWWLSGSGQSLAAPPPLANQPLFGQMPGNNSQVHALAHLLLALTVVIVAARVVGFAFRRLSQPPVVGEMIAGILLGPSLLGQHWPDVAAFLIPPSTTPALSAIGQIGVILFMFLVGVHLDPSVMRQRARAVVAISQASIVVPFALGAGLATLLYTTYATSDVPLGVFVLFMGLSMSVTAFPVLARILSDRGMSRSPLGHIALTCAAVNDVSAWCLLALVVSVAKSSLGEAATTTVLCALFLAFTVLVLRPLAAAAARHVEQRAEMSHGTLGLMAITLLLSALATESIGVHALFGAFLLGAVVPHDSFLARYLNRCLHDVTVVFLLPAYFAYTGLRTQIGLIDGAEQWLVCALIVLVASVGKVSGTMVAARLSGVGWRDASMLGALMNTRGLMEIIILNVGLDLRVLSPLLFTMLVLMAIATTVATAPVLALLQCRQAGVGVPGDGARSSV